MFEDWELIRNTVNDLKAEYEMKIAGMDPADEYEGCIRMMMKSLCRRELIHRCALLIPEGIPEEDLRELFGDEVYERAEKLYSDTYSRWAKKHKLFS